MSTISSVTNVNEFEYIAKEKLPKMVFDFIAGGADDKWSLRENREAFERIRFRPRILRDVSNVDTRTTVLGFEISMPIMIAPSSMHKLAHPDGELATAKAASAQDTAMVLSSLSTTSLEDVGSSCPGLRFFQLYVYRDRNVATQLVKRAEAAGFKALVLTVDHPIPGTREDDIKNRFTLPRHLIWANFEGSNISEMQEGAGAEGSGLKEYAANKFDRSVTWKDVKWLQSITSMPVLLKGILTAEDAEIAVHHGVAGIIVSNQWRAAAGLLAGNHLCSGGSGECSTGQSAGVPRQRCATGHRCGEGSRAWCFRGFLGQVHSLGFGCRRRGWNHVSPGDVEERVRACHGLGWGHQDQRDHPQSGGDGSREANLKALQTLSLVGSGFRRPIPHPRTKTTKSHSVDRRCQPRNTS